MTTYCSYKVYKIIYNCFLHYIREKRGVWIRAEWLLVKAAHSPLLNRLYQPFNNLFVWVALTWDPFLPPQGFSILHRGFYNSFSWNISIIFSVGKMMPCLSPTFCRTIFSSMSPQGHITATTKASEESGHTEGDDEAGRAVNFLNLFKGIA